MVTTKSSGHDGTSRESMAVVELDQSIIEALSPNCTFLSATGPVAECSWVDTIKVTCELPDGNERLFFVKVSGGENALEMARCAYESEQVICSFIPEWVPEPIAIGQYKSGMDRCFFLCEFAEMEERDVDPESWAKAVSTLHLRTKGKSPTGKFGFHTPGYLGDIRVNNTWNSSWEKFWTQQLRSLCEEEERRHPGQQDGEFDELKKVFIDRVIPRYLRPLETNGQPLEPCLLHNDLWTGNVTPRKGAPVSSGELCIFDSACTWGLTEADISVSRTYGMDWDLREAADKYLEIMGDSAILEPKDEYWTRLDLYSVGRLVLRSGLMNDEPERRDMCKTAMRRLIDKALLAPTLNVALRPPGRRTREVREIQGNSDSSKL